MAQYKFVIKGIYYNKNRTFPDLNDYLHECGRHPQLGGKLKRDYQIIAVNAIRKQLGRAKAEKPIQIHYAFYEADMGRDKGNIFSFADKVIEDALQKAGFLKNDNWVWIDRILSPDFYVDKDNPRIEVTLTETDWEV